MGVRDPAGVRGPQDVWRHRTLLKRGAGPGPFAGKVGLRTTGVRPLGRQGVVILYAKGGTPPGVPTSVFLYAK